MPAIQSFGAFSPAATPLIPDSPRQTLAVEPANTGDTVTISKAAREALAASGADALASATEMPGSTAGWSARAATAGMARDLNSLTARTNSLAQALTAELGSIAIWT